ncbi:MAG: hypothetical protein U1F60_14965 [Planctomycetota bacterium]
MHASPWIAVAVAAAIASYGVAQQVTVTIDGPKVATQDPAEGDDPGRPVEMFENPNIDRYLRSAQGFLDRANYEAAIQVLQDVIEGRTLEVTAERPEDGGTPSAPVAPGSSDPQAAKPPADGKPPEPPEAKPPEDDGHAHGGAKPGDRPHERDTRNSVFSSDGRLFRPVRRLCQEMLARMPEAGLELYAAAHEVAAKEQLDAALLDGSSQALEQVVHRYFATAAAGRAMLLLGDRLMQEGRYRSAVQVFRDLLEVYPAVRRQQIGVREVWCRFKIAVCLRLVGEVQAAHEALQQLATRFPAESLRLQGELQAIVELPGSALFVGDLQRIERRATSSGASWLSASTDTLVPLWQYRFRNPEPYADPKTRNNERRVFFGEGQPSNLMPHAGRYGPSTWVCFGQRAGQGDEAPEAVFLEHFRLRVADAASGVQQLQSDGVDEPPAARDGQPRLRIAASDFALLRPVEDDERRYVVVGRKTAAATVDVLKTSELVAYPLGLESVLWSSTAWLDGEAGLRDVTFLAAPVVFGERLLLPSLRRGSYSLECLDRRTGRPMWNVPIHGGGSPFLKAPGCQVVVQGGIALVATNAGCVAAIDAFLGELRWVRRYERIDPLRHRARGKRRVDSDSMASQVDFAQGELTSFLPNDLLIRDGFVLVAPCDGELLLCLDVGTGQLLWYVDASTHYAPYGRLTTLVGTSGEDVFALSQTHLVAIGLAGGLVKWAVELPTWNGNPLIGRGRGVVVGDHVVVPGQRELLVCHVSGQPGLRRLPLPTFGASREPLPEPSNLTSHGPWLAIGHQGGIEMFSSVEALQALAANCTDPHRRATLLLQAGLVDEAEQTLVAALRAAPAANEARQRLEELLLQAVDGKLRGRAGPVDLGAALACYDAIEPLLQTGQVRVLWHLARVELCKAAGDVTAHEREQLRLYARMEGRS